MSMTNNAPDYHEHIENVVTAAVKEPLGSSPVVAKLLAIPNANDPDSVDLVTIIGKRKAVWTSLSSDFFSDNKKAYQLLCDGEALELTLVFAEN